MQKVYLECNGKLYETVQNIFWFFLELIFPTSNTLEELFNQKDFLFVVLYCEESIL